MNNIVHRPRHSPLGASSAERWIHCPGSVELIRTLTLPESDEADFRTEGTAAHALAAHCLTMANAPDAWELIGEKFGDAIKHEVDTDMANAVQLYLDTVRPLIAKADEAGKRVCVEYPISSPIHKDFYGTTDLAVILPGTDFHDQEDLDVTDYKHGAGIAVDAEHNPQLMYYAFGVLQEFPECVKVTLRIVQPRAFHADGPVREWHTTADAIRKWVAEALKPAMDRTEIDHDLAPGDWCRFCPAKLVCPVLNGLFRAAATANPAEIVNHSDEALSRSYLMLPAVKHYTKALEDEMFRRLNGGKVIGGVKLVNKKANRVWKAEALALFKSKYPNDYLTAPEMKSPAEMEKVPGAAPLVKEYAYTPAAGLTVAPADDRRVGVKVQTTGEAFGAAVSAMKPAENDELEIPDFLKRKAS